MMRTILAIAICLLSASMFDAAKAEVIYPWCAYYAGKAGGHNCGFTSLQQCQWSISGNGGTCNSNPLYNPPGPGSRYRR